MAVERAILFGLVPLLVVVLGFRDRPSRYGLRLGDARAGVVLAVAGCLVMTPVVLWFATLPDVRAYYAPSAGPVGRVVLTNLVDLTATEFLFRGFLMLTLVRVIGPLGVLVAAWPFVFAHLGKPELELLSTLGRRPGLRLAGVAHGVDRVGCPGPHLDPTAWSSSPPAA